MIPRSNSMDLGKFRCPLRDMDSREREIFCVWVWSHTASLQVFFTWDCVLFFSKAVVTWMFASTSWQQESSAQECLGENARIMGISLKKQGPKGTRLLAMLFSLFSFCVSVSWFHIVNLMTLILVHPLGWKKLSFLSMYYSLKWSLRCLRCFFCLSNLFFSIPPNIHKKTIHLRSIFQSSILAILPDQGKSRFKGWQRNFSLYSCTFIWWMFSGLGRGSLAHRWSGADFVIWWRKQALYIWVKYSDTTWPSGRADLVRGNPTRISSIPGRWSSIIHTVVCTDTNTPNVFKWCIVLYEFSFIYACIVVSSCIHVVYIYVYILYFLNEYLHK